MAGLLVIMCAVTFAIWRSNPFAALARACDQPALRRSLLADVRVVSWPRALGWWPAVALFFTVACGELIYNGTATLPAFTAWGLVIYAVVSAVCGLLFGAWSSDSSDSEPCLDFRVGMTPQIDDEASWSILLHSEQGA